MVWWWYAMHDSREYERGRWGEVVWNAIVHASGWSVIATGDYSGPRGDRAPMMHGMNEIVLPDFDTAKRGTRVFLECKLKARWFEWRKTGTEQTGIDTRSLAHYRNVEDITGSTVILGMLNETSGQMRANTLHGLGEERESPDARWPTSNWDVARFRLISTVDPIRLHRLLYDGEYLRQRRPLVDASYLTRVAKFLCPVQGELNLLHYDILAREKVQ